VQTPVEEDSEPPAADESVSLESDALESDGEPDGESPRAPQTPRAQPSKRTRNRRKH